MNNFVFKIYVVGEKEYFEFTLPCGRTTKRDFPFSESLIDFYYLDFRKVKALCERADRAETEASLKVALNQLASIHIYFQLLRLEYTQRTLDSIQEGEFMDLYQELRDTCLFLENEFSGILNPDLKVEAPDTRVSVVLDLQPVEFRKLTVSYELVEKYHFAEVLYPQSVFDLIDYFAGQFILRDIPVRKCKNCGKYFALTGHQGLEYCNRVIDERGRTCREIGAKKVWELKSCDDKFFTAYRKEYKKRFARIKAGKLTQEDFYAWGARAREQMKTGGMSLEEYECWLKGS